MKAYCKDCQYYIPFSQDIKLLSRREDEDGSDICGASLNTEINYRGDEVIRLPGKRKYCEECGCIVGDSRRAIYQKCVKMNKAHDCKSFKAVTRLQRWKYRLKGVIIKAKDMLAACSISGKSVVIYLSIFSTAFIFWSRLNEHLTLRAAIIYLSVSVPALLYVYYKAR